jgi:hypothetical protein
MVYMTSIALTRSWLFITHARTIATTVIVVCGAWAIWGISGYPEQGDALGALMFTIFFGLSVSWALPMVYRAAFFITTWLEILGTAAGAWKWAVVDPVFGLTRGNHPSGVAVWYCLVDAVALSGGPLVGRGLKHVSGWLQSRGYYLERVGRLSDLLGFRGHAREDIQTQRHRTSQAISTSLKNPDLAVEPLDKT